MEQKSTIQLKFGKRVRELRMKTGMSQEQLGFKANLDRTYISGIERGERNPSLININRLAKALQISLENLFKL